MRNLLGIVLCFLPMLSSSQSTQEVAEAMSYFAAEERPRVLLLGTFHFNEYKGDNSGNEFTADVPDVMTETRQIELDALVEYIQKFNPTKICVERHSSRQEALDHEYSDYLKAGRTEKRNEINQLAFRLAKKAELNRVFAIDAGGNWYMDSLVNYAVQNGQGQKLMEVGKMMPGYLKSKYEQCDSLTFLEIFKKISQPEEELFIHAIHQSFTKIGAGDVYLGSDLYHDWMGRNTRIFSNIYRLAEPNDRIVVLFGGAHIHSLRSMLRDSYDFEELSLLDLN